MSKSRVVLVVETDPDLRDALVSGIEEAGYEVVTASEPGAAYSAVKRHSPEMVVLGLAVRGRREALQFVDSLARGHGNPRVLLVSAPWELDPDTRSHVTDYLKMPFGLADLERALGRLEPPPDLAAVAT